MFNITLASQDVNTVNAIVNRMGYSTEVDSTWHEQGRKYVDLCIAPDAMRYSRKLAQVVEKYQA
jgi:hypothetical protein